MSWRLQPQPESNKESTALSCSQGAPEGNLSMPCSLQANSSLASYPTHLEISLPQTALLISDKIPPVESQHSHPSATPPGLGEDELKNNAPGSYLSSNSSEASSLFTSESVSSAAPRSVTTTATSPQEGHKQTTASPSVPSKPSQPATPLESSAPKIAGPIRAASDEHAKEAAGDDEEEETFFAFVILHAAEDVEAAEAMRERLESICGGGLEGATFSEDFALPGRSSLRCIDDAIENSAFTILLLTKHFRSSRRFQVEAESALINSIEHRPKYNTVVPLLPRDNGMTLASLPIVLQTLIPLEENRSFDRKIKRLLSAGRVRAQRSVWAGEQKVKRELRRQERMKVADKQRKLLGDVHAVTAKLEHERLSVYMEHALHMKRQLQDILTVPCEGASALPLPLPGWQQQPSIHVENAKYIMIGNDSTMSVDFGGLQADHVVEDEDN